MYSIQPIQSNEPSTGFCFNSLQNVSHSSSVSNHLAKHLSVTLWYLIVTSVPTSRSLLHNILDVDVCKDVGISLERPRRKSGEIEAMIAVKLRHSIDELLPSSRRCVHSICVMSERMRAMCKTNELLMTFIYNQNRSTYSNYPSHKQPKYLNHY